MEETDEEYRPGMELHYRSRQEEDWRVGNASDEQSTDELSNILREWQGEGISYSWRHKLGTHPEGKSYNWNFSGIREQSDMILDM